MIRHPVSRRWIAAFLVITLADHFNPVVAAAHDSPSSRVLLELEGPISFATWSSDGKTMAVLKRRIEKVASKGGTTAVVKYHTVRIHDAHTGAERLSLGELADDGTQDLCFSPDGRTLAVSKRVAGATEDRIELYDWANGVLRKTIVAHYGRSRLDLAYSPDGNTLATTYGGPPTKIIGGARLFDAQTGQLKTTLLAHSHLVNAVAFSPDGKMLATAGNQHDREVRLWNLETGTTKLKLDGLTGSGTAVAFSPDGQTLAVADSQAGVRLWDVKSGKQKPALPDNRDRAASIAFSRNGRWLASGRRVRTSEGWSGEVTLWDLQKDVPPALISETSTSLFLSPDNQSLWILNPEEGGVRGYSIQSLWSSDEDQ